jgi:hypothetical protein
MTTLGRKASNGSYRADPRTTFIVASADIHSKMKNF